MTRGINVAALRDKGIRFKHFYDVNGRLVGTIVTSRPDANGYCNVAAAICSPKDSPDKEFGRRLALRRLRSGRWLPAHVDDIRAGIRNRSILGWFPGGDDLPPLRPAQPFVPRPRVKAAEQPVFVEDDLPF